MSAIVMLMLPAFTACRNTSMVAIDVVTMPVIRVDAPPALIPSTESGFHSTPMVFLIRSSTCCAVTGSAADNFSVGMNGAAAAAAARAAN